MNDIEQKALALINEILKERRIGGDCDTIYRATDATDEALCRAIEQHEAFRQEVSDAVKIANDRAKSLAGNTAFIVNHMQCFIIPKPKPDPLVEAMKKAGWGEAYINNSEPSLRAALDALGFEIREKNDDTDN